MQPPSDRSSQAQCTVRPLWLALMVILFMFIGRGVSAPEIWADLAAGRRITSEGLPRQGPSPTGMGRAEWLDARWLFHALLYGSWKLGGARGIFVFLAGGLVVATLPWARYVDRHVASGAVPLAACVLLCATAPWWTYRAPFTQLAPAALVLWGMKAGTGWGSAVAALAQIAWANMDRTVAGA